MYDLGISAEHYHSLMALSGVLCGFLVNLFLFIIVSKI